jgi:hypothetical protein
MGRPLVGKRSSDKGNGKPASTKSIKDKRGVEVPKKLRPTFQSLSIFREHIRVLQNEIKDIQSFLKQPGSEYLRDTQNNLLVDLANAIEALKTAQPYAVCPFCFGQGCKKQPANTLIWCLGRGYLTKEQKGLKEETWARLKVEG